MRCRLVALSMFVLALAGCASAPRAPKAATATPAVAPVNALPFWVSLDALPADAQEHPCGAYVMRAVERLPTDDAGVFGPEWIVEYATDGSEVTHWPAPVDFMPESIDGPLLLVADNKQAFWVESNGSYKPGLAVGAAVERAALDGVDCPKIERFGDSAYLQCARFLDRSSGKARYLAFQTVCS